MPLNEIITTLKERARELLVQMEAFHGIEIEYKKVSRAIAILEGTLAAPGRKAKEAGEVRKDSSKYHPPVGTYPSLRQPILEGLIKHGPSNPAELMNKIGVTEQAARSRGYAMLTHLVKYGCLSKTKDKRGKVIFRIAEHGKNEVAEYLSKSAA